MYGFNTHEEAQKRADALIARNDGNRYEVAIHKHPETNIWGRGDKTVMYGVQRYVPYCEAMPERFDGFVWFASART